MPIKQSTLDDLIRQISKLAGLVTSLLERFARGYEELDAGRLAIEEQRELLQDHFEENARWADRLSRRLDRLEQYIVLARMGDKEQPPAITQEIKGEHLRRRLREEATTQRELLLQYHRNADQVRIRIAKYGETIPLVNELADYEQQIERATEAISRIQAALNQGGEIP